MQNGENHKFIVNPMPLAQRQYGAEGFELDDKTARRINEARGGGQPLDGALQEQMGASLVRDFNEVRIHTGAEADDLNRRLSARAFTIGSDIFFTRGAYDPNSISGRELIAHELIHVVQQRNGGVSGDARGMTVRPAGDEFEQEADKLSQIVAGTREVLTEPRVQRRLPEVTVVQRALQGQTGNINGYPMDMPKSCVNVVLYWLYREVLAFDPNPTTQAKMLTACGNHTPQSFMDNLARKARKRSRLRGNLPIIVDAGSVLFFTYAGRVEHVCVMDALGLTGLNQGGWWMPPPAPAAHVCPANGLCTHPPAEINWSGWYNASVKKMNRDHSVYTLPGEKAVKAVKNNLGIP
jgi:hypothetical protein